MTCPGMSVMTPSTPSASAAPSSTRVLTVQTQSRPPRPASRDRGFVDVEPARSRPSRKGAALERVRSPRRRSRRRDRTSGTDGSAAWAAARSIRRKGSQHRVRQPGSRRGASDQDREVAVCVSVVFDLDHQGHVFPREDASTASSVGSAVSSPRSGGRRLASGRRHGSSPAGRGRPPGPRPSTRARRARRLRSRAGSRARTTRASSGAPRARPRDARGRAARALT